MENEDTGSGTKMKLEIQGIQGQNQHSWVPGRQRKQAERKAHQRGQAREFNRRQLRFPSDRLPKIMPEKYGVQNVQRRQITERERVQIQNHKERMIRGRELIDQRLKESILRKSQSQLPSLKKLERVKKEMKDFERANAHPLRQPPAPSQIQMDILREQWKRGDQVSTVMKPYQRRFMVLPFFLRSHVRK